MPLVEKVWRHCDTNGLHGRTVTVKVKYSDFHQVTRSHTGRKALASLADLKEQSFVLLDSVFPVQKGIRLLGVTVSSFQDAHAGEEEPQLSFDL